MPERTLATPNPVLLDDGVVLVPVPDDKAAHGVRMMRVGPDHDDYPMWLARAQQAAAAPSIDRGQARDGYRRPFGAILSDSAQPRRHGQCRAAL